MSPAVSIVLLWFGFGASHILLSSDRVRPRIVDRIGNRAFLGVYSLVAFAFFVPLVSVYLGHRHEGPYLWTVGMTPAVTWSLYVVLTVGVVMLVAGMISPSPTSMTAGRGDPEVRGIHRITRHPVVMGLSWIGLFHMIPNAWATDLAFFAGFPAFGVLGALHQERRQLGTKGPAFAAYVASTPFLPFSGSGALRGLAEIPPGVWAAGIATSAALRWLHGPLFG